MIDCENILTHLSKNGAINVPSATKNKKELRKRLEKTVLPDSIIQQILKFLFARTNKKNIIKGNTLL
jgi:hypothetical protein